MYISMVLLMAMFILVIVISSLMYSILPPSVANELRHQHPVPARKYPCVTILFSGIVGFPDFCARHADHEGAMKIVQLLNNCYIAFDKFVDPKVHPNIYKVSCSYNAVRYLLPQSRIPIDDTMHWVGCC